MVGSDPAAVFKVPKFAQTASIAPSASLCSSRVESSTALVSRVRTAVIASADERDKSTCSSLVGSVLPLEISERRPTSASASYSVGSSDVGSSSAFVIQLPIPERAFSRSNSGACRPVRSARRRISGIPWSAASHFKAAPFRSADGVCRLPPWRRRTQWVVAGLTRRCSQDRDGSRGAGHEEGSLSRSSLKLVPSGALTRCPRGSGTAGRSSRSGSPYPAWFVD